MTSGRRGDPRRGRHKRGSSPETQAWQAAHLPPVPPAWMDPATSAALLALRAELDPLALQPAPPREAR